MIRVGSRQRPYHVAECLSFNLNVMKSDFEGFFKR